MLFFSTLNSVSYVLRAEDVHYFGVFDHQSLRLIATTGRSDRTSTGFENILSQRIKLDRLSCLGQELCIANTRQPHRASFHVPPRECNKLRGDQQMRWYCLVRKFMANLGKGSASRLGGLGHKRHQLVGWGH